MKPLTEKAWLLDLDGTLYSAKPLRIAMAAELALLGANALRALRAFRRHHEVLRHELLTDPELEFFPNAFEEQLRRAVDATGLSEELVRQHVEEWMIQRPTKWMRRFTRVELLTRVIEFRSQGGKTALVSDYPARTKLESMGIHEHFDTIVASGEHPRLRRLKPAPDAFLLAAEELGAHPGECLVIGDRDDADGSGARAAGMKFELVD
jgi:HAD superfamily hydrolase (TIGR01549 family)